MMSPMKNQARQPSVARPRTARMAWRYAPLAPNGRFAAAYRATGISPVRGPTMNQGRWCGCRGAKVG